MYDVTKNGSVFLKTSPDGGFPKMKLIFAGTVSLRSHSSAKGVPGPFPLCKVVVKGMDTIEIPLYIHADEFMSIGAQCPIPAWLCNTAGKQKAPTAQCIVEKLVLGPMPASLSEMAGCGSVEVAVPTLQLISAAAKKKSDEDLEIVWQPSKPRAKKGKNASAATAVEILERIGAGALCTKTIAALEDGCRQPDCFSVSRGRG
jgi:hypothetical protein